MPDREKVMRGLEVCLAADLTEDENPCAPCPYFFDGMCQNTMKEDALALLREQEPVEPFHECSDGLYPRTLVSNKYFVFCPYCGRRIKWNDA